MPFALCLSYFWDSDSSKIINERRKSTSQLEAKVMKTSKENKKINETQS